MSDTTTPQKTESKSVECTGPELDAVLKEHLATDWRLVAQTSQGGGDFLLTFARKSEGER